MSKLLINESPRMVLPSLAVAIGLKEAMLLQQMHFWLRTYEEDRRENRKVDDRWWVKKSNADWQLEFPWWSEGTVKRARLSLEESGLIESAQHNTDVGDQTNWYTINYTAVSKLSERVDQDAPMGGSGCADGGDQDAPLYKEETKDKKEEREKRAPEPETYTLDDPPPIRLPDFWDRNGREPLDDKDRADRMQFQQWWYTWAGEKYQMADNRKRNCAMYALRFWTAKEIQEALKTACGKADRSPWSYFVACLEQMAHGQWEWERNPRTSKSQKQDASAAGQDLISRLKAEGK